MRPEITNAVAIDCEMVTGENGKNALAQVSLCNEYGQCFYNCYVKQPIVTNYRTHITGITAHHLRSGRKFRKVHREVADIIRGKLLVGHALDNDLRALGLGHPHRNRRDLAEYFRTERGFPSLKSLAYDYLGWTIQDGYHNAVEDARATMRVYKEFQEEWEEQYSSENDSDENDSDENDSDENDSDENSDEYDSSEYDSDENVDYTSSSSDDY